MVFRHEIIGDCRRGTWIYAMTDGPDGPVRYIGKTSGALHKRHKAHIQASRSPARAHLPVNRWLRKVAARPNTYANAFSIKALEYVASDDDWAARERFWIAKYRDAGAALLNLTDGGEGLSGLPRPENVRQAIAAKLRTGGTFSCEVCGAEFWRKQHEIKSGHNRFCSRRCSNARHKGPGLFA